MPSLVALSICLIGVLGLLVLQGKNDPENRSRLWVPSLWIMLISAKPLSFWFYGVDNLGSGQDVLEGSPLERMVFSCLILAAILQLWRRKLDWGALIQNNPWIILLLLYCGLTITWSEYPDVAFKRWVKLAGSLSVILLIVTHADAVQAMKTVVKRCGYIFIPLSIVLIKYYPAYGRVYSGWTGEMYIAGVGSNKNSLGYICLITGLFFLWDLLNSSDSEGGKSKRLERRAGWVMLAGALWLLVRANSKTSMVCFLVGVLLLLLFKSGLRPVTVVRMTIGSAAAIFLLQGVFDVYGIALETLGRERTLTDRTLLWQDIMALNENPMLGAGFGSFWLGERLQVLWDNWSWGPNQAHNGYLEVYVNIGSVGLLMLGAVILSAFRKIRRAIVTEDETGNILFVILVVALLFNYTEAAFLQTHFMWILFLFTVIEGSVKAEATSNRRGECGMNLPARPVEDWMKAGTG